MRKHKILLELIYISVMTFVFLFLLSSCDNSNLKISYRNHEDYKEGEIESETSINSIKIYWVDGEITVKYHDKNTVKILEDGTRKNSFPLYSRIENQELTVQFAESGSYTAEIGKKSLTLFLPKDTELSYLNIKSSNSNIKLENINANSAYVKNATGNIDVLNCKISNNFDLDSVTGINKIELLENCKKVTVKTVSAENKINIDSSKSINIKSVSGNNSIKLNGSCQKTKIKSVSGKIDLFADSINELEIENISENINVEIRKNVPRTNIENFSGNVTISLPEICNFEGEFVSVTGSVKCRFSASCDGDKYKVGQGGENIKIKTTNGNIEIKKN